MDPRTRQWADDLARFVADHRAARPARAVPMVAAEAAAHDEILAGHLRRFLDRDLAVLRRHRAALAERTGVDPDPVVVVMTNPWGLPATSRALLAVPPGSVIAVTELEFRYFSRRRPDEGHRHHVNHWSWIKTRVPPERHGAFARFPLADGEAYWLHRTGTTGTGRERRFCHLWKWNGRHAALLEANVIERGVAEL